MISRLFLVLIAVLLAPAGCHDEVFFPTTVVTPPTVPGAPVFTLPAAASGITGVDEALGGFDIAPDGQPRIVFARTTASGTQIFFSRRNPTAAWTAPLAVSSLNVTAKTSIRVFATADHRTQIFWLEGPIVRYSRVDNATPPALDPVVNDLAISTSVPANVTPGATLGAVDEFTAVFDRPRDTIFLFWAQLIDDDGAGLGVPDEVPVAAAVAGGTGSVGEYFALLDPNTDPAPAISGSLTPRVSDAGTAHALWAGTDAAGATQAVRHSSRTGVGAWSGGAAGDVVSDAGTGPFSQLSLLLAPDEDAYAGWMEAGPDFKAAHRPAGTTTTFTAPLLFLDNTTANLALPVLEPGTEIYHVISRVVSAGSLTLSTLRWTLANLGSAGALSAVDTLAGPVVLGAGGTDVAAWADSQSRVVVAYHAPAFAGDDSHTFLTSRPSGGSYTPAVDLTASFPLPCAGLNVSTNAAGNAVLAWSQGEGHTVPLTDVFAALYTLGGTTTPAQNISASAPVGSHGLLGVWRHDSGGAHVFWHEATTVADEHDVYYARTP